MSFKTDSNFIKNINFCSNPVYKTIRTNPIRTKPIRTKPIRKIFFCA